MTDLVYAARSPIAELAELCTRVAPSDESILVTGETGVGKEVFARFIHEHSPRVAKEFVPIHCAAIPETLLESELFGYKRGAFTDAQKDKPGRIASAEGGTLFLDEIGELSPAFQVKLLRVVQEKCYESVGSLQSTRVDFRLIAATNKNLAVEVEAGRFRRDLYYRLLVCPIEIPPLRRRRGDIPHLFAHFWAARGETRPVDPLVPRLLEEHTWPGNVRELENLVARLSMCVEGRGVTTDDLPHHLRFIATPEAPDALPLPGKRIEVEKPIDLPRLLQDLENGYIDAALMRTGGNKKAAASLLGLNRTTLVEKLKRRGTKWTDSSL
jgi:sigma-54 specific flagellar transcriptional regulator A